MNLSDEVDLEDFVGRTDKISAAEISSICQEAGMQVCDSFAGCMNCDNYEVTAYTFPVPGMMLDAPRLVYS